jgi:hypothetical protein
MVLRVIASSFALLASGIFYIFLLNNHSVLSNDIDAIEDALTSSNPSHTSPSEMRGRRHSFGEYVRGPMINLWRLALAIFFPTLGYFGAKNRDTTLLGCFAWCNVLAALTNIIASLIIAIVLKHGGEAVVKDAKYTCEACLACIGLPSGPQGAEPKCQTCCGSTSCSWSDGIDAGRGATNISGAAGARQTCETLHELRMEDFVALVNAIIFLLALASIVHAVAALSGHALLQSGYLTADMSSERGSHRGLDDYFRLEDNRHAGLEEGGARRGSGQHASRGREYVAPCPERNVRFADDSIGAL